MNVVIEKQKPLVAAAEVPLDLHQQSLELVRAARNTTDNLVAYANFQLLGNTDQLQKSLSTGNLSKDQIRSLMDSMIKGPLRRYVGMLRGLQRTLDEIETKVQLTKTSTP